MTVRQADGGRHRRWLAGCLLAALLICATPRPGYAGTGDKAVTSSTSASGRAVEALTHLVFHRQFVRSYRDRQRLLILRGGDGSALGAYVAPWASLAILPARPPFGYSFRAGSSGGRAILRHITPGTRITRAVLRRGRITHLSIHLARAARDRLARDLRRLHGWPHGLRASAQPLRSGHSRATVARLIIWNAGNSILPPITGVRVTGPGVRVTGPDRRSPTLPARWLNRAARLLPGARVSARLRVVAAVSGRRKVTLRFLSHKRVLLVLGVVATATGTSVSLALVNRPSAHTTASPPPCAGTYVPAGSDLQRAIDDAPEGGTLCLAAGSYPIPANLHPRPGMTIQGAGSDQTLLKGDGATIIIDADGVPDVTVTHLSLAGASAPTGCSVCGRGYRMGPGGLASHVHVYDNPQTGITSRATGVTIRRSEIDHNGSARFLGCCAGGVKVVGNHVLLAHNSVHDNIGMGLWADCAASYVTYSHNRVVSNSRSGILYEIGPGPAVISDNYVSNNNLADQGGHGGIRVVASNDVNVTGNIVNSNALNSIYVHDSPRSMNGLDGCGSGFLFSDGIISHNTYGPQPLSAPVPATLADNTRLSH